MFKALKELYWAARQYLKSNEQFRNEIEELTNKCVRLERQLDGLRILHESTAKGLVLRHSYDADSDSLRANIRFSSSICKSQHFDSPIYNFWCEQFKERPHYHRKQWEWVFISQALQERGVLASGKRGLGFGVGREPLTAVFAAKGCKIVATDGDVSNAREQGWDTTNQYAENVSVLNDRNICLPQLFAGNVRFRTTDMNNLPGELREFDFCWSACALEHLGSIENGLRFIKNSLKCLAPGGVAVHTTEFNLYSNEDTIENSPSTVIFRRRDLESLFNELLKEGHEIEPLDLDPGSLPVDRYIDPGPFYFEKSYGKGLPHLKLLLGGYVTTSVGLIIRKATLRSPDCRQNADAGLNTQ